MSINKEPAKADPAVIPAYSPSVMSDESLDALLPTPVAVPKAVFLNRQGETPQLVGFIRSGLLRLSFSDESGRTKTLGLRAAGWWANAAIATLGISSPYSLETVLPCSISFFPAAEFVDIISASPRLAREYHLAQCKELLSMQQLNIMRESSAQNRLRHFMGESGTSIWKTTDPKPFMRQSDIAELLGVTAEHLSRIRAVRATKNDKRKS